MAQVSGGWDDRKQKAGKALCLRGTSQSPVDAISLFVTLTHSRAQGELVLPPLASSLKHSTSIQVASDYAYCSAPSRFSLRGKQTSLEGAALRRGSFAQRPWSGSVLSPEHCCPFLGRSEGSAFHAAGKKLAPPTAGKRL